MSIMNARMGLGEPKNQVEHMFLLIFHAVFATFPCNFCYFSTVGKNMCMLRCFRKNT